MKSRGIIVLAACIVFSGAWVGCQKTPTKAISVLPEPASEHHHGAAVDPEGFGVLERPTDSLEIAVKNPFVGRSDYLVDGRHWSSQPLQLGDRPSVGKLFDMYAAPQERGVPISTVGEELWVIYRAELPEVRQQADEEYPGTGLLVTQLEQKQVILPLKQTDVRARIEAYIASVDVTQQYENPYSTKIEAVYVFPLPENGAVNEFVMTVGERRIRGIIRERAEAEKIYAEAKQQGYVASLMTQERPNIFTQSVANIEPGKQIDIAIKYYHTLTYDDGWYEFVFPMVVGPRFNPPGSRDGIGAINKSGLARSGQPTDIHYLKPFQSNGHRVSLELTVNPGVAIEEFSCKTHKIEVEEQGGDAKPLHVMLSSSDALLNKDFVFRYRIGGQKVKSGFVTHMDERGQFFTFMLYPPMGLESLERAPLELVFVLDCSGSMSGKPLAQAKSAIEYGLKNLRPGDSFQLINFSNDAEKLAIAPLEATPKNIRLGLRHLENLQSEGGTMMIEGIKAALEFRHDPERFRFVCFLTDGYIGNESEILQEIHKRLGSSRIFSFGVGSSVNRFLLDSMAKVGRGAVAYLGLEDTGSEIMGKFFERISHPAMSDVKIDWGDLDVRDVYPRRLPDLLLADH
jgi:Ca-activated chloride channel homolog